MDKKPFVERMLEVENLTDELEDREAKRLLHWGIGKLDGVLQNASDADDAGARVNRLMAVMRKINRIAGGCAAKNADDLAGDLQALETLCGEAFDSPAAFTEADGAKKAEKIAAEIAGKAPGEAVELLIELCDLKLSGNS